MIRFPYTWRGWLKKFGPQQDAPLTPSEELKAVCEDYYKTISLMPWPESYQEHFHQLQVRANLALRRCSTPTPPPHDLYDELFAERMKLAACAFVAQGGDPEQIKSEYWSGAMVNVLRLLEDERKANKSLREMRQNSQTPGSCW